MAMTVITAPVVFIFDPLLYVRAEFFAIAQAVGR